MTHLRLTKAKPLALLLLILTSIITATAFLPAAKAATTITTITPTSGNVGTTVTLLGEISNAGDTYKIRFDNTDLKTSTTSTNLVNASFTIPEATAGNHTIMLLDTTTGENATQTFTVLTSYTVKAEVPEAPKQLQEGDTLTINASITGSDPVVQYLVNVTVKTPNNASYNHTLNIMTSSVGSAQTAFNYTRDFSTGANTNFTGQYQVSFGTYASTTFFVGLTNSSQYHRSQAVDVKAIGYSPYENVTLSIGGSEGYIYTADNITADAEGTITYINATVLSEAPKDTYTVRIISTSNITNKVPADTQTFIIPGYSVNITTLNLAGETVSSVTLKIREKNATVAEGTSALTTGLVTLLLENGTYKLEATYKDTIVGEDSLITTGESSLNFSCNLTNLRITVTDTSANKLPEIVLFLAPDNRTLTTDANGTVTVHSLLPNANYTLNASRYDILFNTTTITQLPTTAWYDLPITCPTFTLQVNVTNANGQPINSLVKAQDLMGGLVYQTNTVNGLAILNCTLGRYAVGAYASGIKLNETVVDLNNTIVNVTINCGLYGLDVSVRVIDFLGQSIPDVNVTMQRQGIRYSSMAGTDGRAVFSSIIGGDLQITIRLSGQTEPCIVTTVFVGNSTSIDVKIEKYVIMAGLLVETSQFLTVIVIVLAVVLVLSLEILRRIRLKPQKNES